MPLSCKRSRSVSEKRPFSESCGGNSPRFKPMTKLIFGWLGRMRSALPIET